MNKKKGPFVTEDKDLTSQIPDHHNTFGQWQGEFRVGHLDLVATRYALDAVGGVDGLVVTNIDRLSVRPEWLTCSSYEYAGLADVSELFQGKDNIVTGINTGPYRDLQYQERLTSALMDCEPRYDQVSPSLSDKTNDREGKLLKTIEETLERPIILTSHGPTVGDKRLRSDRFLQVGQHA